ncbi:unnamed protein product [Periconia digitata]|uniref:Uncharacterized protein n=1 Tax=Periconia digitata TaxID=1303443 RepID=A0A9W4U5X7_9PLEO|nr:unnamed protein product [Periconia digitata]
MLAWAVVHLLLIRQLVVRWPGVWCRCDKAATYPSPLAHLAGSQKLDAAFLAGAVDFEAE